MGYVRVSWGTDRWQDLQGATSAAARKRNLFWREHCLQPHKEKPSYGFAQSTETRSLATSAEIEFAQARRNRGEDTTGDRSNRKAKGDLMLWKSLQIRTAGSLG